MPSVRSCPRCAAASRLTRTTATARQRPSAAIAALSQLDQAASGREPVLRPSPRVSTVPRGSAVLYDAWDSCVPYQAAWDFQRAEARSYADAQAEGAEVDRLIILQHEPVYTLGTGSTEDHLKFDINNPKLPTFRTERGGEVTYHGPGQLVMYPILNLRDHKQDLHWYMRSLEEVVILALDSVSGLQGERVPGLTGVWVDGRKVAAIGVRATRWITYHGLALNVVNSLEPFSDIVPCGISDRPVSSVLDTLNRKHGTGLDQRQQDALLEEYSHALLEAFSQVFGLELVAAHDNSAS